MNRTEMFEIEYIIQDLDALHASMHQINFLRRISKKELKKNIDIWIEEIGKNMDALWKIIEAKQSTITVDEIMKGTDDPSIKTVTE